MVCHDYMTGSQIIQHIKYAEQENLQRRFSTIRAWHQYLLIGVSDWLGEYGKKLHRCGYDILWGKTPTVMDNKLRNELLMALLAKMGDFVIICGV